MINFKHLFFFIVTFFQISYSQKSKVTILGVGHSTQLINYNQQPAALKAFINKVNPTAIAIERSPEEYSKNDFYEFTYEQQYLIIPYAIENKIQLHPIDWISSEQDLDLAFGIKILKHRILHAKEIVF